jgi:hypothetical protein
VAALEDSDLLILVQRVAQVLAALLREVDRTQLELELPGKDLLAVTRVQEPVVLVEVVEPGSLVSQAKTTPVKLEMVEMVLLQT